MPTYVVTFEDGHAQTLDASTAMDAAKAAKAAYESGKHRVLRVRPSSPNGRGA
jgi:hypothetical protein